MRLIIGVSGSVHCEMFTEFKTSECFYNDSERSYSFHQNLCVTDTGVRASSGCAAFGEQRVR